MDDAGRLREQAQAQTATDHGAAQLPRACGSTRLHSKRGAAEQRRVGDVVQCQIYAHHSHQSSVRSRTKSRCRRSVLVRCDPNGRHVGALLRLAELQRRATCPNNKRAQGHLHVLEASYHQPSAQLATGLRHLIYDSINDGDGQVICTGHCVRARHARIGASGYHRCSRQTISMSSSLICRWQ